MYKSRLTVISIYQVSSTWELWRSGLDVGFLINHRGFETRWCHLIFFIILFFISGEGSRVCGEGPRVRHV